MNLSQPALNGFLDELSRIKEAAELSESARDKISPKNFAVKEHGQEKYPIEDASHARNALGRVRQFGDTSERDKVYAAVARKYPELASHSSVKAVKDRADGKSK